MPSAVDPLVRELQLCLSAFGLAEQGCDAEWIAPFLAGFHGDRDGLVRLVGSHYFRALCKAWEAAGFRDTPATTGLCVERPAEPIGQRLHFIFTQDTPQYVRAELVRHLIDFARGGGSPTATGDLLPGADIIPSDFRYEARTDKPPLTAAYICERYQIPVRTIYRVAKDQHWTLKKFRLKDGERTKTVFTWNDVSAYASRRSDKTDRPK